MRISLKLVWLSALTTACSQGGPAREHEVAEGSLPRGKGSYATILEAPPRTPITRLGPEPYEPPLKDRRHFFAARVEEKNLPMLRRIKREQIGNFGGIEWRWHDGPENGGLGRLTGIAYFLRAPEMTLARYTRDPLFRAAKGDFSRTEQDQIARRWAERIGLDNASFGFGNMSVPWLNILMPQAEFEAKAKTAGWRTPVNLALRFDAFVEPDLPAVAPAVAPLIRMFPQQARLSGPVPDIATFDAVVLRDGCFFIDQEGDDDPLIEFPLGIGVFRDAEGHLSFRTRYSERPTVLGRVGTRLQLGYRSPAAQAPAALRAACGAKKIVSITSADQAAGYGSDWLAVKQYRDRHRVTSAEALRGANACLLEHERMLADRRLRGKHEQPTKCVMTLIINPVPPPPPVEVPNAGASQKQVYSAVMGPARPKLMQPNRNGICRFEERHPSARPKGLIQTNWKSNMIFWADPGAALWDHPNDDVGEGMIIVGKRIVAQREGLPDLWISPARSGHIMFYSGPAIFECRMRVEP